MRHGWEWWEAFWGYIMKNPRFLYDHSTTTEWLKDMKKKFEKKWREGLVQTSP